MIDELWPDEGLGKFLAMNWSLQLTRAHVVWIEVRDDVVRGTSKVKGIGLLDEATCLPAVVVLRRAHQSSVIVSPLFVKKRSLRALAIQLIKVGL